MINLKINGTMHQLDVEPDMPLLWAIRDTVGLTGTKYGCGAAYCGACTVLVGGIPMRSCKTPVSSVQGLDITTIEGLQSKEGKAVQEAWQTHEVVQCGFCQSGQIMAATVLLTNNPKPDDAAIDAAMGSYLCRCATYMRIREAIKHAAKALA